ncbi:MAG: hypothetical protein ARM1_0082 [Candidatus Micrarchaeota archaeon]|nr:MAG: hypothetical protein ARM1_0082 [Candidatus Micrarchaeota archaeon]
MNNNIVFPGDSVELDNRSVDIEEFGIIENNKIKPYKEIRLYKSGDSILGKIIDDQISVLFVKILPFTHSNIRYISNINGKIMVKDRGDLGMKLSDIILARIVKEDKDTFLLSLEGRSYGVVLARCSECGSFLVASNRRLNSKEGKNKIERLICKECGNEEYRAVSQYYGKLDFIKKILIHYSKGVD